MRLSFLTRRLYKLLQIICSKRLLKALLSQKVLAGTEHRQLLQRDLATIVDVGANRGQFALAARNCVGKARIISFEPLSEAANKFRQLFVGDAQVTIHQAAISRKVGEETIHVAAADDSSSLYPISPLQELLFPGTGEVRTEVVKTGPLSNYIQPEQISSPALLKIDVQGYELEALIGCESLLDRFDYIYAECSFVELYVGQPLVDEVIAWLRERGWRLAGIFNMTRDRLGSSIQGDFLFKKAVH